MRLDALRQQVFAGGVTRIARDSKRFARTADKRLMACKKVPHHLVGVSSALSIFESSAMCLLLVGA